MSRIRSALTRRLLAPYYRRRTEKAVLDSRLLGNWCDYRPAHRHVEWTATVDGSPFGQSCFTHLGALMVDACRTGGDMTLGRTFGRT
jgi:hypothetical protein